jgi:hypothetical protein
LRRSQIERKMSPKKKKIPQARKGRKKVIVFARTVHEE